MKIELDTLLTGQHKIDAYSEAGIIINKICYQSSIIVTPEKVIENWSPQSSADLAAHHFADILALDPEIVLLGTGMHQLFPASSILEPLMTADTGYEIMDTRAACRAYNILVGEGRRVIAALIGITDFNPH